MNILFRCPVEVQSRRSIAQTPKKPHNEQKPTNSNSLFLAQLSFITNNIEGIVQQALIWTERRLKPFVLIKYSILMERFVLICFAFIFFCNQVLDCCRDCTASYLSTIQEVAMYQRITKGFQSSGC